MLLNASLDSFSCTNFKTMKRQEIEGGASMLKSYNVNLSKFIPLYVILY